MSSPPRPSWQFSYSGNALKNQLAEGWILTRSSFALSIPCVFHYGGLNRETEKTTGFILQEVAVGYGAHSKNRRALEELGRDNRARPTSITSSKRNLSEPMLIGEYRLAIFKLIASVLSIIGNLVKSAGF